MILSDFQIERIQRAGCWVTFQPEFLMRFGATYLRQLGSERSAQLKRARSLLDAGVPLAFSSDRPIVAGDPMDGVRTAVHRPTGFSHEEAISWPEAFRAYTIDAARIGGDEPLHSNLEPGTAARFIVLPGTL